MAKYPGILLNLFLLSTFLLSSSSISGKDNKISFFDQISWDTTAEYPGLPFSGNGFFNEQSGVPVYRITFPLPEAFSKGSQTIEDIHFSPIRWEQTSDNKYLTDVTEEDVVENFTYRIVTIRKNAFLEVEIIPFRNQKNQPTEWEKLLQFSVELSFSDPSSEKLKSEAAKYATSSNLQSGTWVKIGSKQRGIHKIPYATLEAWGFSNPSKVQIYGNGGTMVPMANSKERPDDLPAIGCLHSNNALYFYSPGTWHWVLDQTNDIFHFERHKYSQMAFFFLSETKSTIKTPEIQPSIQSNVTHTTNSFDALYFHESENENVLKSGNQWFGEKFNYSIAMERNFEVEIPNLISDEAVFYTQVAGRSNSNQTFNIGIGESANLSLSINTVSLNDDIGYYLRLANGKQFFTPSGNRINIKYNYSNPSSTSVGWLDFFIINARGRLSLNDGPLVFRDKSVLGSDNITQYRISGASASDYIWDVTNPVHPVRMTTEISDQTLTFTARSHEIKEYVAFNPAQTFPQPTFIENVENQNLHATGPAEMIIVAPTQFLGQANRLATLHNQHSDLSVVVAERDKIYNEFSWGHPDPGAIRSFLRMLYDRAGENTNKSPKLLLLFGDGTYDNRHINNTPAAPLPTYQSDNSIYHTHTFVTDDFFGFLDDYEGADFNNDRLDIGIGRFPVSTQEQAVNAVNKTETYLLGQQQGKWKNKLTFIGDDGDFNIHTRDADRLAQKVAANHSQFDLNKIYFDAFKMTSGAVGKEFPGAKSRVMQAISEGTLILNYTGHGGENNLAHEKIITKTDINSWKNKDRLPLFVTATCEFSRFDNHNHTSGGEEVFLNPNGGGIALLSTTRIVYSFLNYTLNSAFYNHAFEKDENGLPLRLGEIMRRTKLESGSNTNKLNFTLLGDPALRLIYPANQVATSTINNIEIAEQPDTIRALSKNRVSGIIKDPFGNSLTDFSGTVSVTVFDKAVNSKTLGNGGNEPFEFKDFSNILFQGKATVTAGEFSVEFVVPKDIRYNFDNARISYYATSDNGVEAAGAFSDVIIGGISQNAGIDKQGPAINLYMNHPGFKSGQTTGSRPMLYAGLFDDSGINTSGIGIGHNITLVIDGDTNNPLVLNDAFSADTDHYQRGLLAYQLPMLEDGTHTITLKVWDNYNNSSTASLTFKVTSDHGLNVRDFSAFPNPVSPGQDVYITMKTDTPNALIKATIQFVDSSGKVTGTVEDEIISSGNLIGPYKLPMEKSGWNYSQICFVRIILNPNNGEETQVVAKLLPTH